MEEKNVGKTHVLRNLFFTFIKIGIFTFGGGYAMISLVEDECVGKKHWITHDEMSYLVVLAESTPGPMAVNSSTYVGYKKAGMIGSIIATVGVVLPSFVIILIIATFLDKFLDIVWVANAFRGIKVAVGILILNAAIGMMKHIRKEAMPVIILLLSTVIMLVVNIFAIDFSTIALLTIAGGFTFLIYLIKDKPWSKKGGTK